ncbi:hypothetical protein BJF85_22225 [Saccharomonospora sp. CUA-673]|nr:hypothetical protein BJF85_22225 [Saccharomonospora sp. CUA-673]
MPTISRGAVLVTTLLALVLSGCSGAGSESRPGAGADHAPVTATDRVDVQPFAPNGEPAPGLTVIEDAEATCSASGVDLSDPAARRCMTTEGYLLYDPCYVRADTALCLRDPDSTDAVRIHMVEDRGPRPLHELVQRPWLLELADGRRCVLARTPDPDDPAEQPTYTCGKDDHLFGMPDTSAPVWTIGNRHGTDPAPDNPLRDTTIRTAWF